MTLRQRSIAKLTLSAKLADYQEECGGVMTCMTPLSAAGQPFVSLAPQVAAASATLADLNTKASAATGATRSPTTIAVRNTAWDVSRLDMEALVNGVQTVSDANPSISGELITKAGMRVWMFNHPVVPPFAVKYGLTTGTAITRVKSPGRTRTVEVQASADGGKTWPIDVFGPELVQPFSGLTPGVLYLFRYRYKLPKVAMSDWSDSISLMMK